MTKKSLVIGIFSVLAVVVIIMSLFVTRRMMNLQISFSTLASDAVIMNPVLTVSLPETQNSKGSFTCTGLTYDTAEDVMWGGYYGRTTPEDDSLQPALIKLDLDFHIVRCQHSREYGQRRPSIIRSVLTP